MVGVCDFLGVLQILFGSINVMVDQFFGFSCLLFDMIIDDVGDGFGVVMVVGVLIVVDEDGEDDEEVEVFNEFEYFFDVIDLDDQFFVDWQRREVFV